MNHGTESGPPVTASTVPISRPPITPTPTPPPLRRRRCSPVTPRQALLLETTSEGVSAGVKAISTARRLALAAEFLPGNTGDQGHSQNHPCEPHLRFDHLGSSGEWSVCLSSRYALPGSIPCRQIDWHERFSWVRSPTGDLQGPFTCDSSRYRAEEAPTQSFNSIQEIC